MLRSSVSTGVVNLMPAFALSTGKFGAHIVKTLTTAKEYHYCALGHITIYALRSELAQRLALFKFSLKSSEREQKSLEILDLWL